MEIYLSQPPENDNFANRTALTGSNVSVNGDNAAATMESGEPYDTYYYSGFGYKSVWYTWTAPSSGAFSISVSATTMFNPILAVYTGTQLSSLSTVTDIVGGNYNASFDLGATSGQTYQIEIDDYSQTGGPYTLTIAP